MSEQGVPVEQRVFGAGHYLRPNFIQLYSSRNVLIEDSVFSTGDDCVVIKSGLNADGWRVGKPSENIVVRRLHGERGHGGVVIGS